MESLNKLQATKNRRELARLLGFTPQSLAYILYRLPDAQKYRTFAIPKSGGGLRQIKAPNDRLKLLQQRLANLLQNCYEEISDSGKIGRELSHGFRKNHSIITNARRHRNKRFVFNIDLKDFFPSINFGRVRGFFIKSKDFSLNSEVATVIAQIACHDNELPQGSPVSPVISNLIGNVLDIRLVRLAKEAKCTYSRYADDITFSTREKEFPKLIAKKITCDVWSPSDQLTTTILETGFEINQDKISMQYSTNRQTVTGLIVNWKVNIKASYYRQARAMCDSLFKLGEFYIGDETKRGKLLDKNSKELGTINQLRGILNYIYTVKNQNDRRESKQKKISPSAIRKLYQSFLYYEKFHILDYPLIICEGKSDVIYLKCALKSLAGEFPSLINIGESETMWRINFYKYSNLSCELLQLSGGTGNFKRFINGYEKWMKLFKCNGCKHPVILIVDNDADGKSVWKLAKKIANSGSMHVDKFYCHIAKNLYLVILPPPESEENQNQVIIEDYFDDLVRSSKIKGKSFHLDDKGFDSQKHYGKIVFSSRVVRANQKRINFIKFQPLLKQLESTIEHYKKYQSHV